MALLEMNQVCYSYTSESHVLSNVSAIFEIGKMYAILGPSGSGKTTLLSLLGGLDTPSSGKILFHGEDIARQGLMYHRRNHISFIFQTFNLIDYMTSEQNVKLTAKHEALPVLKRLGLTEAEAKRNVLKLSGGQQQRVAIARSLACGAPVLLADEPTGNLDEGTAAEIIHILKDSAHRLKKCVIVVTHSNELAKQADTVLQLKHGSVQVAKIY